MKEIQKKYKGDRQKLNEELMKFYKENNINPAASCLPLARAVPGLHRALLRRCGTSRSTRRRATSRGCTSSRTSPTARERALVGLRAARDLRGEPGRLDVLHVGDDGQDAAAILMMILPLVFIPFIVALPDRPRPLLDDDEPLDGRPGADHAAAGPEGRAAGRPGRSARRERRRKEPPPRRRPAPSSRRSKPKPNGAAQPRAREAEEEAGRER